MKNPFVFIAGGIIAGGVLAGGIYFLGPKNADGNIAGGKTEEEPSAAVSRETEASAPEPAPETVLTPQKPPVPDSAPEKVKAAVLDAPSDMFIGIGSAKLPSLSQSRTLAASRAKVDITRQINSAARETVTRRVEAGGLDSGGALQIEEKLSVKFSEAVLAGAVVLAEDADESGAVWAAVGVNKAGVTGIIESGLTE